MFLSLNRTLAPLQMVLASDDTISYAETDIYNFGFNNGYLETWCTTDNDPNPYIEMGLTSPVLITQILSSGRTTPTESYYVTNFTIEYSPLNDTAAFNYYTTESGSIQVSAHIKSLLSLVCMFQVIYTKTHIQTVFPCTSVEHLDTTGATSADTAPSFESSEVA